MVSSKRYRAHACAVARCEHAHYAKGLCKKHYTQVARHGRLTPERERGVERECAVARCTRTDTVGVYCRKHARQVRTHGRLTPEREHQMGHLGCQHPGCESPHRAKGYCVKHYNQMRWQRIKQDLEQLRQLAPGAPLPVEWQTSGRGDEG